MTVKFGQTLTNGMIDAIKDEYALGFILGALDKGWTVRKPGAIFATKGRIRLLMHAQGSDREVWVFHRDEDPITICGAAEFQWSELSVLKVGLYYNNRFICKTD